MARKTILGIDFGTSYSSAAILVNGKVQFVYDNGEPTIPTVVHLPERGEPIVGSKALLRQMVDPASTITSVKRLLGKKPSHPDIRTLDAGVGYQIKEGPNGLVMLSVRGKQYAAEQIAAFVLEHLKRLAEQRFGTTVTGAVVGVPAAAGEDYILALKRAARIANLEIIQVVPEPIAGALAMGLHTKPANRLAAICDFGGGTFDATIVDQVGQVFNPIATHGDPFLGGDDFDRVFADGIASLYFKKTQFDMHRDAIRWQKLLFRCESVKRMLSSQEEAQLTMTDAYVQNGQRGDIDILVDRNWVESKWATLVKRALIVMAQVLNHAGKNRESIERVVLIGGTGLVPIVRRGISEFFGGKEISSNEWATLAVVTGLALQSAAHGRSSTQTPSLAAGV